MTDFWTLEPEVAGELGEGTVLDRSVHPPKVSKLEYRFTGWLGDELLETFPCYIVTDRLGAELLSARLTGFELDAVSVVASLEFSDLYPGRRLPTFRWLKVSGTAGVDDFGLSDSHSLVVSDGALLRIRRCTLSRCDVERFVG